jgi:hypothetical protein
MLRRCPARAFIAFLCLCIKRLSVARSGDIGVGIPRFAVVVAVSLTASGAVAPRFETSDVPSRDSVMSPSLSLRIYRTALAETNPTAAAPMGQENESLWRLGCF